MSELKFPPQTTDELEREGFLKPQIPGQPEIDANSGGWEPQFQITMTWSQRIGIFGLITLFAGLFCILGTLAFLYFLWFSDATNSV
jgi:hypothetical protein